MDYEKIRHLNKNVSKLVFGTMCLKIEEKKSGFQLLDEVYEMGITAFDCAAVYSGGESEAVLGEWINDRNLREKVTVITKGAHPSKWRNRVTPYDILSDVHDSLARLDTTYIDVYLLHRDDPEIPVSILVDTLNRLYEKGAIRCFGGSNWTYERIQEANEYAYKFGLEPFTVTSPNYSLARQVNNPWGGNCVTLSGPEQEEARTYFKKLKMPVLAYSSLGRGFLSGKLSSDRPQEAEHILDCAAKKGYVCKENFERLRRAEILAKKYGVSVPQIAVAWVIMQPYNVFPIIGAKNATHMKDNVDALKIKLTQKEQDWLDLKLESLN